MLWIDLSRWLPFLFSAMGVLCVIAVVCEVIRQRRG